jgi:hypothetical protein
LSSASSGSSTCRRASCAGTQPTGGSFAVAPGTLGYEGLVVGAGVGSPATAPEPSPVCGEVVGAYRPRPEPNLGGSSASISLDIANTVGRRPPAMAGRWSTSSRNRASSAGNVLGVMPAPRVQLERFELGRHARPLMISPPLPSSVCDRQYLRSSTSRYGQPRPQKRPLWPCSSIRRTNQSNSSGARR